jgi:hypothetical protein
MNNIHSIKNLKEKLQNLKEDAAFLKEHEELKLFLLEHYLSYVKRTDVSQKSWERRTTLYMVSIQEDGCNIKLKQELNKILKTHEEVILNFRHDYLTKKRLVGKPNSLSQGNQTDILLTFFRAVSEFTIEIIKEIN